MSDQHDATSSSLSDSAFLRLCESGGLNKIKQALADGANPNAADQYGCTALMRVLRRGPRVAQVLVDAGADVNAVNDKGLSVLEWALSEEINLSLVQMLLAAGVDVRAPNDRGTTPLMQASRQDSEPETALALLAAGADPHARDRDGYTALILWARETGGLPVVQALLAAGVEVNVATNAGMTALMYAARYGKPESTAALLAAGADANVRDNEGRTALVYARESLDSAAYEDEEYRTPYREVIRVLEQSGASD